MILLEEQDFEDYVVFSGGGAGGIGQWNQYKHWKSLGNKAVKFAGASAGSLNALLASRGLDQVADELYNIAYDGRASNVFGSELAHLDGKLSVDVGAVKDVVLKGINVWDVPKLVTKKGQKKLMQQLTSNVLGIQSLLNNRPLLQSVKDILAMPHPDDCEMIFGVVNLLTGQPQRHTLSEFDDMDMAALAIVASTTIPVILPLVPGYTTKEASYKMLGDGGLRDGSPIGSMLKGLDPNKRARITVFNINRRELATVEELSSAVAVAGRTLQIALNQILISNLEVILERNKIALTYGERPGYRYVPIRIIEASHNRSVLDFSRESAEEQIRTAPGDVDRTLAIPFT